jgi:oligopeptide/dipeptide ABC transporter ATP-binding protein
MATDAILTVRNLRTHFPTRDGVVRAVDGVSFDLHPGRTLGIVGESGCGKSVMTRSILRILDPPGRIVEGSMMLRFADARPPVDLALLPEDGEEIRKIRGREIALIFQEPMASFSQYYTVGDQIFEAIRLHTSATKAEARAQAIEMLRRVGIPNPERRIDEYPFQLSGGLRQRVMIAMALACNPRVLIADEPTTALDVTTQAQVLELLRALRAGQNLSIILITHDMGVIAEMADDVVVMYLGRAVETGPVEQIFHDPKHPYTRALLRSIPSVDATPRARLATMPGAIPHPLNRPAGCPFHPRCAEVIAGFCDREMPPAIRLADGREVACVLHAPSVAKAPA